MALILQTGQEPKRSAGSSLLLTVNRIKKGVSKMAHDHHHHHQDHHHHHQPPAPQKADLPAAAEGQIKVKLAKLGEEAKILDLPAGAKVADAVEAAGGLGVKEIVLVGGIKADLAKVLEHGDVVAIAPKIEGGAA